MVRRNQKQPFVNLRLKSILPKNPVILSSASKPKQTLAIPSYPIPMQSATPDKRLFTPGPLNTSLSVKAAMQHDLGSRDGAFVQAVHEIRRELLRFAGLEPDDVYECVLMQGAGTFGVESVVSSSLRSDDKLLVLVNGAYGERIVKMAQVHKINVMQYRNGEDEPFDDPEMLDRLLADNREVTHVAVVHCETTTGLLNPIERLLPVIRGRYRTSIVDAMSSFGGIPLDVLATRPDFVISSSNKCIEGVPGFSFILAHRDALNSCCGQARSLSLDLYAQWAGLEADGQFRFTPPTHALLAFRQALRELEAEGGVAARHARYSQNHQVLLTGLQALGFKPYLRPEVMAPIITAWHYPQDEHFDFKAFYEALNARGFVIYPGKLSQASCFRLGNIGQLQPADMQTLVTAIDEVAQAQGWKPQTP
jgi:2-aminoethylphosphonate-pyruvate transaminase